MKNPLSLEAFADWCEKQPADKAYDWNDGFRCACAQYAKSLGLFHQFQDRGGFGTFWRDANLIAFESQPHAFGALATRLREASHA